MRTQQIVLATVWLLVMSGTQPGARHQAADDAADAAFVRGDFTEAERLFRATSPRTDRGRLRLAELALMSNRHGEVEATLRPMLASSPDHREAAGLLAESCYRRDDFVCAAPLFDVAGQTARAAQLRSFGRVPPNRIEGPDVVRLPFVAADPLPVVTIRINGGDPINVLIDTGGSELILDTDYAAERNLATLATSTGRFAADQRRDVALSRVARVDLGALSVHDVPVALLPTRRFGIATGGRRVDGIIGTVVLYHFTPTLDYRNGALHLRRTPVDEDGALRFPFWLSGSHVMVAWGALNGTRQLMFLDTGLAGLGFAAPRSTIDAAGITLNDSAAMQGQGGGGTVRVIPFMAETLAVGPLSRTGIMGVAGAFPESLERAQGFRIGGLVSHSFFRPFAITFDFVRMQITAATDPRGSR